VDAPEDGASARGKNASKGGVPKSGMPAPPKPHPLGATSAQRPRGPGRGQLGQPPQKQAKWWDGGQGEQENEQGWAQGLEADANETHMDSSEPSWDHRSKETRDPYSSSAEPARQGLVARSLASKGDGRGDLNAYVTESRTASSKAKSPVKGLSKGEGKKNNKHEMKSDQLDETSGDGKGEGRVEGKGDGKHDGKGDRKGDSKPDGKLNDVSANLRSAERRDRNHLTSKTGYAGNYPSTLKFDGHDSYGEDGCEEDKRDDHQYGGEDTHNSRVESRGHGNDELGEDNAWESKADHKDDRRYPAEGRREKEDVKRDSNGAYIDNNLEGTGVEDLTSLNTEDQRYDGMTEKRKDVKGKGISKVAPKATTKGNQKGNAKGDLETESMIDIGSSTGQGVSKKDSNEDGKGSRKGVFSGGLPLPLGGGRKARPPEPPKSLVEEDQQAAPAVASIPSSMPPVRLPPWKEDGLSDQEIAATITSCKVRGIELELSALTQRIPPTEEHQRACQRCITLLQSAITAEWGSKQGVPPPLVDVCGAFAQGTEIHGSEMDVAFRVPPGLSPEDRHRCVRELQERLQVPPQSAFLAVHEAIQMFPHTSCPYSVELIGARPRTIAHLLLADQPPEDGGRRPLTIDSVIKQLCDFLEISRHLIRLTKLWATNRGLAAHHEGYPTGVAWTLIVLFFLQRERLMPPFTALAGAVAPATDNLSLLHLLRGFFEFLAGLGPQANRGLSVAHAQEYRAPSGILFIEDPAEMLETRQQRNLTLQVGERQWRCVLDEARKTAGKFTAEPQRWFHWAEIFDPGEVPNEKILKLQPLSHVASTIGFASLEPSEPASARHEPSMPVSGAVGKAPAPAFGLAGSVSRPSGKGAGSRGLPPGPSGQGKGSGGHGFGQF